MEEKRCPEPGCGGVLEQEKNANKRIQQIFVCVKCDGRYYLENGKFFKTKDCVVRMEKAKKRAECGCIF